MEGMGGRGVRGGSARPVCLLVLTILATGLVQQCLLNDRRQRHDVTERLCVCGRQPQQQQQRCVRGGGGKTAVRGTGTADNQIAGRRSWPVLI